MIPVKTGFIFPNGIFIETGGIGHRRCADRYIVENNLTEELKEYGGESDEFLIEKLGAIKICQYSGKKYVYITKKYGWYMNEIISMYKKEGYTIIDCYIQDISIETTNEEYLNNYYSYNQTLVQTVDEHGKVLYKYNPRKIGD